VAAGPVMELYDAAWLAWHEWARAWRLLLGSPVG